MNKAKQVLLEKYEHEAVIFANANHLILGNPRAFEQLSPACDIDLFHEVANNVISVPPHPYVPQKPMPASHRAVQRSMLRDPADGDIAPDAIISKLVNTYSKEDVEKYLKWVSTDYEGKNLKITRNSWSTEAGKGGCADTTWRCSFNVVDEIQKEIESILQDYPFDWEVEQVKFRSDMCNNIVVKIRGELEPDKVVVIGAHMDSRNTGSGSTATGPAPGADDNGSGTAVELAILSNMASNPVAFTYSVHLMWFCGEEQGLYGSAAMASSYKSQGINVIGMFNNDMIGYTYPSAGMTLSFMNRNAEPWLSQSCKAFANTYVPSLKVGDTGACCSDQQSFYAQGFPAAGIFETPTASVVYPQYHKTGDTWDNGLVNIEQVYRFGQANYACILEYAVPLNE